MSDEKKIYGHTMEDLYEWIDVIDDKQAQNAVKIEALEKRLEANLKARLPDADWETVNKNFIKIESEIAELKKKFETLDLEKKLKIDYMLKMNQLEKNDKAHQALYDKLFEQIAELKGDLNIERMTNKERYNSQKEFEQKIKGR